MFFTNRATYGFATDDEMARLMVGAHNWAHMVDMVCRELTARRIVPEPGILIEHSPSAAVSTKTFLERYPDAKIIHLIRDPRDSIASMMERRRRSHHFRGLPDDENLRITAFQWTLLTACALDAERLPGYLRVSYENLVADPQAVIARVLSHLEVKRLVRWEGSRYLYDRIQMGAGWLNSPLGQVTNSSIGRYRNDLEPCSLAKLSDMTVKVPELDVTADLGWLIERFGVASTAEIG